MTDLDASTVVIENLRRVATLCGDALEGDVVLGIRNGRVRFAGLRGSLPREFGAALRHDAGGRLLT
ncbi:MAG: hypothetical protein HUU03_13815, partial [Planctomycetaceae bacterium]|nr:hypothetical protein [Planctomycetaceae bacterium]